MVTVRHFAELENNIVKRILCVSEVECLDNFGNFHEILGETFCIKLTGSLNKWIECSTDGSVRKNACHVGNAYDENANGFYDPNQPFPSWSLDKNLLWQAPIAKPENIEGFWWYWDESALEWVSEPKTP